MRVLEFYCGIGGCAAALPPSARVVAAIDIHRGALDLYGHHFDHPRYVREIEAIGTDELASWDADLWWLSPPCQPFTRRGKQRDLDDPRTRSLMALLDRLPESHPSYVALENVPQFLASRTWQHMSEVLASNDYAVDTLELCPSELGIPNRRRRAYVLARHARCGERGRLRAPPRSALRPLREFLETKHNPQLLVDPNLVEAYRGALDVVEADDEGAVTACFTAAYGRSPVRSGSYLATPEGLRRFAPREIARLLGYPARWSDAAERQPARLWPLLGNSLSVHAVRHVLSDLEMPTPAS